MEQALIGVGETKYPEITLLADSEDISYALMKIHCLRCGLPIGQINDRVLTVIDNVGPIAYSREMHVTRLQCKRCGTGYRLYRRIEGFRSTKF